MTALRRSVLASVLGPLLACVACGAPGASTPSGGSAAASKPGGAAPDVGKAQATSEATAAKPTADESPKAAVGAPAPEFTLTDLEGKSHSLASYRGKVVVLEWFNPECPFVKGAHDGGVLATMAGEQPAEVQWLAINSGAPGKQGHGADINRGAAEQWKLSHPILLDESGEVGRAYGATNTPHVFVIDKDGVLAYRGAPDNAPMGEVDGGGERTAFLASAITATLAGSPVDPAETRAWGCGVKYGS